MFRIHLKNMEWLNSLQTFGLLTNLATMFPPVFTLRKAQRLIKSKEMICGQTNLYHVFIHIFWDMQTVFVPCTKEFGLHNYVVHFLVDYPGSTNILLKRGIRKCVRNKTRMNTISIFSTMSSDKSPEI